MVPLQKIKNLVSELENISIGYSEINIISPEELVLRQTGYSIDPNRNTLITGCAGDWQEGWFVIATDGLGDPFFVDFRDEKLPVFTAPHGEATWEAVQIADGITEFKSMLAELKSLAFNRGFPSAIEANSITPVEISGFLRNAEKNNPNSDIRYWETFLTECS